MAMPVNELGRPGVPVTDVFMEIPGLPPAINSPEGKKLEKQAGLNGGQGMLALADHSSRSKLPKPVTSLDANNPAGKRRVTVLEDKQLRMPCLCLSVYLAPCEKYEEKQFAAMFTRALCKKANTPEDADLVLFAGGTDVNPELYGHGVHHTTDTPDRERDEREIALFHKCKKLGIPMIGICRGAQFLHVMNGGVLYQDIDEHQRGHPILTVPDGLLLHSSSVHHQMIYADASLGIRVLATSSVANNRKKWKEGTTFTNTSGKHQDCEAFFYRDTCCLGFQGHPEYPGYPEYTQWCMQMIEDWINSNADCEWMGLRYRVKKEFIEERDMMEESIISKAAPKKPKGSKKDEFLAEIDAGIEARAKEKKPVLSVPKVSAKKESK